MKTAAALVYLSFVAALAGYTVRATAPSLWVTFAVAVVVLWLAAVLRVLVVVNRPNR